MKKHPNGPYVYSLWSAIPDDVTEYSRWCRYLALYKPMVTQNSVAYIELRECGEILSPIHENIFASMFVNEEKYLVVSNLSDKDYTLDLRDEWSDRVSGKNGKAFLIKQRDILFLIKK